MNCLVYGISAGEAFLARLRQGSFQGKIHSVFGRVCNLICEEGVLYSLAVPDVGNSPNGLVVSLYSGDGFRSFPISQEEAFSMIGLNTLLIGSLVVDLNTIRPWSPIELGDRISITRMHENLNIIKQLLGLVCTPEGLSWLLFHPDSGRAVFADMPQNILALIQAIRCQNHPDIQKAAASIVGFGPGLTPAGDDFLAGVMLGLYWGRKAQGMDAGDITRCNEQVLLVAKTRTHLISYTQLLFASRGQANEAVCDLLAALYSHSREERLKAAVSRVLGLGSTSGGDMIAGIVTAMEFLLKEVY